MAYGVTCFILSGMISRWLILLLLFTSPLQAEIFKYVDQNGATHYVDSANKIPNQYRKKASVPDLPKLNRPQNWGWAPTQGNKSTEASFTTKKVEAYVTSWCPVCKQLEAYLKTNHIRYTRYDIEADGAAHRRYKEMGGSGVPLVKVGDEIMHGYSEAELTQLLK